MVNILYKRNVKVVELLPAFANRGILRALGSSSGFLRRRLHHRVKLRRAIRVDEAADVPGLADVGLVLLVAALVVAISSLLVSVIIFCSILNYHYRLLLFGLDSLLLFGFVFCVDLLLYRFLFFFFFELADYLHHAQAVLLHAVVGCRPVLPLGRLLFPLA